MTNTTEPPRIQQEAIPALPGPIVKSETPEEDGGSEVKGSRLILINASLCLCTFLVGLDFTLIATAIPYITSEFNSIRDVGWYGASFQLAICATQPLAGKTYILFPKKIVYLTYLAIFEIGSLVCALAPTSNALIVGRAVAGLGASGMFAGGFAVQTAIIPLHKRAIWIGAISSTFAIASIVGPVIGGALTQDVTWRWCFYINLPIGGFGAAIFTLLVHTKAAETERRPLLNKLKGLDGIGFVMFAGSIIMLLLALQWGGNRFAWNSSMIIGLLVGFGVSITLFICWQLYVQDDALIPPRLFKIHRNVGLICASSFFVNGPFQLIIYWLPIWFQAILEVSPTQSGVNFLPTVISDAVVALLGTGIVMKIGWWNPFLLLANALVCLCGGLLSTIYPDVTAGHWIGYQILGGIGYSLTTNMAQVGVQTSLPPELAPTGSSNLLMFVSTSCSVFLALGQLTFQKRLEVNLSTVVSSDIIQDIISAGATNFKSELPASADISAVVREYGRSINQVFLIPAAAPVISFLLACGCQWISTKKAQVTAGEVQEEERGSQKEPEIQNKL
ncbi:MFS general substrate transporter [Hypoxylon sp. EC38]|nr:MFS general substrate transporter [Hypoxylon sp. EC38]